MSKLLSLYLGELVHCDTDATNYEEKLEFFKVYDETRKDFDKQLLKKIMKMEYDAETLGQKYVKIKRYEKELSYKKCELISKEHNNGYVFITINPKPGLTFEEFQKSVEKAVERNIFTSYRYVYEQRGSCIEEQGKGFHCHMLCKRNLNYKPSKVTVNLKNTFKKITNVDNPALLNIQHIGEDFAKDKNDYITSVKTGEGKDVKQEVDVVWREAIGIEAVYGDEILI